jgi:hypothetical protein
VRNYQCGQNEGEDQWQANFAPCMNANVAYSLYGVKSVSVSASASASDDSSAAASCSRHTYINTFFTTDGLYSFLTALQLDAQEFDSYYGWNQVSNYYGNGGYYNKQKHTYYGDGRNGYDAYGYAAAEEEEKNVDENEIEDADYYAAAEEEADENDEEEDATDEEEEEDADNDAAEEEADENDEEEDADDEEEEEDADNDAAEEEADENDEEEDAADEEEEEDADNDAAEEEADENDEEEDAADEEEEEDADNDAAQEEADENDEEEDAADEEEEEDADNDAAQEEEQEENDENDAAEDEEEEQDEAEEDANEDEEENNNEEEEEEENNNEEEQDENNAEEEEENNNEDANDERRRLDNRERQRGDSDTPPAIATGRILGKEAKVDQGRILEGGAVYSNQFCRNRADMGFSIGLGCAAVEDSSSSKYKYGSFASTSSAMFTIDQFDGYYCDATQYVQSINTLDSLNAQINSQGQCMEIYNANGINYAQYLLPHSKACIPSLYGSDICPDPYGKLYNCEQKMYYAERGLSNFLTDDEVQKRFVLGCTFFTLSFIILILAAREMSKDDCPKQQMELVDASEFRSRQNERKHQQRSYLPRLLHRPS